LNQVFLNIINNAIDALKNQTPPRIITILAELVNGRRDRVIGEAGVISAYHLLPGLSFGFEIMGLEFPQKLKTRFLTPLHNQASGTRG
jgi:signal transduction histidine kinase